MDNNLSIFPDLINNAALLLTIGLIYDIVILKNMKIPHISDKFTGGLLVGVVGIIIMMNPWKFGEGIVFDSRSILLCVSGLFFGLIPTLITVIATASFRAYQGGAGALTGISVIIASALTGLIWRYFRKKSILRISFSELYILGVITHVQMLLLMLTLPSGLGYNVIRDIWFALMIINPLGTALFGSLILNRYARNKLAVDLFANEKRYRSYIDNAPSGVFISDSTGKYLDVNTAAERITGYSRDELLAMAIPDIVWPGSYEANLKHFNNLLSNGKSNGTLNFKHKSGEKKTWLVEAVQLNDNQFMAITTDVTDKEKMEKAIIESEKKYRDLYNNAALGIFHSTFEGKFIDVNPALAEMLGYDSPEHVLKEIYSISEQIYAEPQKRNSIIQTALDKGEILKFENLYKRKNGQIWNAYLHLRIIFGINSEPLYLQGFVEDITERKSAEKEIQTALKEKEILLREIYHRTKNNMQVIRSLLILQGKSSKSDEIKKIIRELDSKIHAMALVHQMLYQSKNLSDVLISDYTENLSKYLLNSFCPEPEKIRLLLNAEQINFPIDISMPFGLILNECITNSIKYAFTNIADPAINIEIKKDADNEITFKYSDNGNGLPKDFNEQNITSLGIKSIKAIVEYQLQGNIIINSEKGLTYTITFKINNHGGFL